METSRVGPRPCLFDSDLPTIYDVYQAEPNMMRYDTIADWETDVDPVTGAVKVTVVVPRCSLVEDFPEYVFLLTSHEQIEASLCCAYGVSQEAVDQWDKRYEEDRIPGDESEPGDHPMSPYHFPHLAAEAAEKALCDALRIDWFEYGLWCAELFNTVKRARGTYKDAETK